MTITLRTTTGLLCGLLLLTACGGTADGPDTAVAAAPSAAAMAEEQEMEAEEMKAEEMEAEEMKAEEGAGAAGAYVDYADFDADREAYSDGTVVLFFHAGWCPTCQQAERNLTADPAGIPAGLTIVKVDFDDATELRRQYGVTQQHTFVSIAPDGSEQRTFTGAVTAADIADQA